VQAAEPATLTLHLLYYPRWQAWVDDQPATLSPAAGTGYAQLRVGAGTHHVRLRYGRSTAEWAGLALAALTSIALAAAGVSARRRPPVAGRAPYPALTATERPPAPWLLAGLTALLVFKFAYVDGATTWLRCVSTAARVCGAQATVDVAFTGAPRLRGYTVSSAAVRRGAEVRVDLYWQGEPAAKTLSSFVHIRRSQPTQAPSPVTGGDIWAQAEQVTPGGLLTTEFLPGKLYKDAFRVQLPPDMPSGAYFLEVGWFDPATGEQLDVDPQNLQQPLRILWRSLLLPDVEVR